MFEKYLNSILSSFRHFILFLYIFVEKFSPQPQKICFWTINFAKKQHLASSSFLLKCLGKQYNFVYFLLFLWFLIIGPATAWGSDGFAGVETPVRELLFVRGLQNLE